jgi:hypothetical protein
MSHAKRQLLEEQEFEGRLCPWCQDRMREVHCPGCDDLTVCRFCLHEGASRYCDACTHMLEKDD